MHFLGVSKIKQIKHSNMKNAINSSVFSWPIVFLNLIIDDRNISNGGRFLYLFLIFNVEKGNTVNEFEFANMPNVSFIYAFTLLLLLFIRKRKFKELGKLHQFSHFEWIESKFKWILWNQYSYRSSFSIVSYFTSCLLDVINPNLSACVILFFLIHHYSTVWFVLVEQKNKTDILICKHHGK